MGIEFNSWKDKVYDIPLENEQPSVQHLNQVQHLLQQGKELEQQISDPLVKREITYLNKELSSADKRMRLATTQDPQQKKAIEREIQADAFETAVTDIMSTMGICEEGLSTEEQTYLRKTFQAYALMGDRLEDATELLGRKLFPPIIEKGQWQALSIEEQQKIKRLVIDTLLMASFQPTRTDTGHSSFSHINCTAPPFDKLSQLKPLQIVEADTLLGYLASSINRGEREASSLFSTLLGSDYQQGSISQKVLLMIAAKQKSMANNPLIQKLYTSPFLDELLFQNMFMTEQQYMNSCVCATVNQALFMQNSTLPS
ncbi:MAG: hypothetical protein KDK65_04375, partial [Chlamydiia bacterium]|nr:hypothetical protein [Chlamydiia bacterium]